MQHNVALVHTIVATPVSLNVRQIIATAQTLPPRIETVVRSHSEDEVRRLVQECEGTAVFLADEVLAQSMTRHVLEHTAERRTRHTGPLPLPLHGGA